MTSPSEKRMTALRPLTDAIAAYDPTFDTDKVVSISLTPDAIIVTSIRTAPGSPAPIPVLCTDPFSNDPGHYAKVTVEYGLDEIFPWDKDRAEDDAL